MASCTEVSCSELAGHVNIFHGKLVLLCSLYGEQLFLSVCGSVAIDVLEQVQCGARFYAYMLRKPPPSRLFPDASLVRASARESRSATQVAPLEISDSW